MKATVVYARKKFPITYARHKFVDAVTVAAKRTVEKLDVAIRLIKNFYAAKIE